MITITQLRDKIQNDLNSISLQEKYNFNIGSEEIDVKNLPSNIKGFSQEDNNIYGVFSMSSGQFEAIQEQAISTITTELLLYVLKTQKDDILSILSTYQTFANAEPFKINSTNNPHDEYTAVPVFDTIRVRNIDQFQGDERVPISVNIEYTIAKDGILSNSISISIDGKRQLVLEGSYSMVKSTEKGQYNGENTIKSSPSAKSIVPTIRIVNIPSTVTEKLKKEIVDIEYKIDEVYSIEYSDGHVSSTGNYTLSTGRVVLVAGQIATLLLTFEVAR